MSSGTLVNQASHLDDSNRTIQGLWIGSGLSVMERLSIASFLQNGHDYHLYAYDDLSTVPAGAVIKDANEILPAARIFKYTNRPSYAGFANHFRYKLLFERGGWWADTDVVCLRQFDFADAYVFASEWTAGQIITNNGIIKAPAGCEVLDHAAQVCDTKKPEQLVWGETGPRLLTELVAKFGLNEFQKPHSVFCPITDADWHKLLEPYVTAVPADAFAVHLWNSYWQFEGQDKNADYHPGCIYELLKRKYLYSTSADRASSSSQLTAEVATSS